MLHATKTVSAAFIIAASCLGASASAEFNPGIAIVPMPLARSLAPENVLMQSTPACSSSSTVKASPFEKAITGF